MRLNESRLSPFITYLLDKSFESYHNYLFSLRKLERRSSSISSRAAEEWQPTPELVASWKNKLPLHTVMRLLQVSTGGLATYTRVGKA